MAEEVSMTTDKRYFLDVGDDLLAIGIFPIRNPVQVAYFLLYTVSTG